MVSEQNPNGEVWKVFEAWRRFSAFAFDFSSLHLLPNRASSILLWIGRVFLNSAGNDKPYSAKPQTLVGV